jgi:phage shock protein PspC (stress-responsive transcriptional regulator)
MTTRQASLFTREDTMLGICQGVGEDLGISSNLLRVALALGLFFSPTGTLAAYAAMGVVVLTSRLLFPDRRRVNAAEAQPQAAPQPVAGNDAEQIEYAQAA